MTTDHRQGMLHMEVPRHPMWTEPAKSERADEGGLMPVWMWNVAVCLARNLTRYDGREETTVENFARLVYDALGRSSSQAECIGFLVIEQLRMVENVAYNYERVYIRDLTDRLISAALDGNLSTT